MTALIGFMLGVGFATVCVVVALIANQAAEAFARRDRVRALANSAALTFVQDYIPDSSEVMLTDAGLPKLNLARIEGEG